MPPLYKIKTVHYFYFLALFFSVCFHPSLLTYSSHSFILRIHYVIFLVLDDEIKQLRETWWIERHAQRSVGLAASRRMWDAKTVNIVLGRFHENVRSFENEVRGEISSGVRKHWHDMRQKAETTCHSSKRVTVRHRLRPRYPFYDALV